jgi:hypothetical protein
LRRVPPPRGCEAGSGRNDLRRPGMRRAALTSAAIACDNAIDASHPHDHPGRAAAGECAVRFRATDPVDRRRLSRGLRRRAVGNGAAAGPARTRHRRAERLPHRGGALLPVRPRDVLVDPARTVADAAADAGLGASGGRCVLHHARDARGRGNRWVAANPSVSPARSGRFRTRTAFTPRWQPWCCWGSTSGG